MANPDPLFSLTEPFEDASYGPGFFIEIYSHGFLIRTEGPGEDIAAVEEMAAATIEDMLLGMVREIFT